MAPVPDGETMYLRGGRASRLCRLRLLFRFSGKAPWTEGKWGAVTPIAGSETDEASWPAIRATVLQAPGIETESDRTLNALREKDPDRILRQS
jgi:hypothetical protein